MCARSVQQKTGIEREVEHAINGATDYISSNYAQEKSENAERSTISVYLLIVEAIWIDQRSKVERSMIAKIAHNRVVIAKYAQIRRAAAAQCPSGGVRSPLAQPIARN